MVCIALIKSSTRRDLDPAALAVVCDIRKKDGDELGVHISTWAVLCCPQPHWEFFEILRNLEIDSALTYVYKAHRNEGSSESSEPMEV